MNKSLAPLIIVFGLVILGTVFLSSKGTIKKPESAENTGNLPEMRLSYIKSGQNSENRSRTMPPAGHRSEWMPDVSQMLTEAQKDIEIGNIAAAEDKLRTALLFEPESLRGMTMLAYIFYNSRRFSESAALFKRIISINPYDSGAMTNLGAALARMNDFNEALKYSLQGLSIDPSSPTTLLNLSGIYAMSGNREKAMEFFRKAADSIGNAVIPQAYDPVFDNIREEPEFQAIVSSAEKNFSRQKATPAKTAVPQPQKK